MGAEKVKQLQKLLNIPDAFTRIDIPAITMISLRKDGLLDPFLEDCQNDSPSIEELLNFVEKGTLREKITFECYVVETTRNDTRLSIEGLAGIGLTMNEMQKIIDEYARADEFSCDIKSGSFRAWWD